MDTLATFRKKYPTFVYERFAYKREENSLIISFIFKVSPDIEFNPIVTIEDISSLDVSNLDRSTIENFIFHLGLIEMVSYWKATCSPKIEIRAGCLEAKQRKWWENMFINGLGEFFYQNKINFKNGEFLTIKNCSSKRFSIDAQEHRDKYLVLNGGGRDSAVTLEVLKELKLVSTILTLNPTVASEELANVSKIKKSIVVKREMDSKLLELNSRGYLNGHTPFSAYLAFLSILCALIFDHKYVIVSNERSANEENIEFFGNKINHQYSKSFEFEKLFRDYVKENLSESIEYFSLLRPLYELQISKIFSNYHSYLKAFKSCNRGQKNNVWCGQCPKCLSVYITFYPFIDKEQIISIFGQDLYEKEELLDLLAYIIGEKKPKPFECVGTYEELHEGLRLSIKKLEVNGEKLPILLRYASTIINSNNEPRTDILSSWDKNNFLTDEFTKSLKIKIFG